MRAPRRAALFSAVLVALVPVAAACTSGTDAGGDVTVTVQTTLPATTTAPPATSSTQITVAPTTVPTTSATSAAPPTETTSTTEAPGTTETSETTGSTPTTATSSSRSTTSGPAPTIVTRSAEEPDVAGPDGGKACPADGQYYDEATTGMLPDAAAAWAAAKKAAAADDEVLCLNDGKRSAAQQQAQYDAYVEQYGKDVADQLVLPWQKSAHVSGYAADVQPANGYVWLQATDGSLGWCRIYDNEPWHFEYSESYETTGCPDRLPEPER
ncbi:hypothetical protein GIS00_06930 [Nakamurella sp. YIM 132087]|uniref:Peptidase M15 n=1 Tax=Nakamurella alba TaxID=2665158 RepID=A0A7K1FHS2_9ACTN|nr:hypothetical protein [Nakamurella alba]MTD13675.1 hypothetical protein [Nakamurella alba]